MKSKKITNGLTHRGRFQAQGRVLEESEAWAEPIPPSTHDGEAMLQK